MSAKTETEETYPITTAQAGVRVFKTHEELVNLGGDETLREAAHQAKIAKDLEEEAGAAYKVAGEILKNALDPNGPPIHGWTIGKQPETSVVNPENMPDQIKTRWLELRERVEEESKELSGIEKAYSEKEPARDKNGIPKKGSLKWIGE